MTSRNNPKILTFLAAAAVSAASAGSAFADAAGDMLIGSSAAGAGDLVVSYPFAETPIVPMSASSFPGLFTAEAPGFFPASTGDGLFELNVPTTVGMEVVSIDANVGVQIGMSVLDAPGSSAIIATHDNADPELSSLHTHPTFLLSLLAPSPGDFTEGRFSFRLFDDDSAYGDSEIHTLTLSNGYLPPIEEATKDAIKCRKAVAKGVRKIVGDTYKRVGNCLDRATQALEAGTPEDAAKFCGLNPGTSGSLAARLEAAHAKALASASKACGTLAGDSEPFTESGVSAHLGMAACRAQELAGATHGEGRLALEETLEEGFGEGTCTANVCVGGVLAGAACDDDEECGVEHAIEQSLSCILGAAVAEHDDD